MDIYNWTKFSKGEAMEVSCLHLHFPKNESGRGSVLMSLLSPFLSLSNVHCVLKQRLLEILSLKLFQPTELEMFKENTEKHLQSISVTEEDPHIWVVSV